MVLLTSWALRHTYSQVNFAVVIFCLLVPVTLGCDRREEKQHPARTSERSFSEQIRQDEARRFGLNTVDPEVGTAGMILVSSICQLEAVCF